MEKDWTEIEDLANSGGNAEKLKDLQHKFGLSDEQIGTVLGV